jgi:protein-S-isoprenylcysteine O-methyltransferase Ste14
LNAPSPRKSREPDPAQWRSIVARGVAVPLVLALLLFAPAGSIAWTRGWLFLLVSIAVLGAAALYLWRINPEIFVARSQIIREGTKRWDRILLGFLFPAILAIPLVAALDDGRFHWSRMSWWGVGLGYFLLTTGVAITAWAQAVNRFFEPSVRIQTERGHRVVDTGPYAIIRHPGYAAACLLFAGIALSLGSWWALMPAGSAALLLVLRTAWEDRTLRAELVGYAAYAQRVRFRLIPWVW